MRLRALVLLLPLAGCGPHLLVPIVAGGGIAGAFAAVDAFNTDADTALALVKPLNQAICAVERGRAHGPRVAAAITTFCNHLPDDPAQLLMQAGLVLQAIETEQAELHHG